MLQNGLITYGKKKREEKKSSTKQLIRRSGSVSLIICEERGKDADPKKRSSYAREPQQERTKVSVWPRKEGKKRRRSGVAAPALPPSLESGRKKGERGSHPALFAKGPRFGADRCCRPFPSADIEERGQNLKLIMDSKGALFCRGRRAVHQREGGWPCHKRQPVSLKGKRRVFRTPWRAANRSPSTKRGNPADAL